MEINKGIGVQRSLARKLDLLEVYMRVNTSTIIQYLINENPELKKYSSAVETLELSEEDEKFTNIYVNEETHTQLYHLKKGTTFQGYIETQLKKISQPEQLLLSDSEVYLQ